MRRLCLNWRPLLVGTLLVVPIGCATNRPRQFADRPTHTATDGTVASVSQQKSTPAPTTHEVRADWDSRQLAEPVTGGDRSSTDRRDANEGSDDRLGGVSGADDWRLAGYEEHADGDAEFLDESVDRSAGTPLVVEPLPIDESVSLTLEALEQLALENNPAIRQASAAARKAMGIRTQVGLLPNPTVGYFGSQLGDAQTDQNGAFLNQDIVLGGKLALNQAVIDQDVQTLLWEVEAQRYRVLTDIRRDFYDALAAQLRLKLSRSFQDVARKGVEVAEERMRALEGARPDILQSEIQLNEVDLITQQALIDFAAAWRQLAATAGMPNMVAPELVGSLEGAADPQEMEMAYAELLGRSPELQATRTRVQRARANLVRQQVQPIPNLQAQLQFGQDLATGSQLGNVQLGMPIPILNKNEGNVYAAQAEYNRATQDVRRLELDLRARLARAMRDYDFAHVTVDRYRNQIIPKADESLQLSEEAHEAGEFDFLRVLVARRMYFEANLNYVQALANLAKANAVIEGLQLSGGLTDTADYNGDDGLRGQALGGQ